MMFKVKLGRGSCCIFCMNLAKLVAAGAAIIAWGYKKLGLRLQGRRFTSRERLYPSVFLKSLRKTYTGDHSTKKF